MIAVTMGDPNGVGPEIALKAWKAQEIDEEFLLVGDAGVLEECARRIGLEVPIERVAEAGGLRPEALNVLDLGEMEASRLTPGALSKEAGAAAYRYVEEASRRALSGEVEAIVTLPLNKEAVRLGVPDFSGHTEMIASLSGAKQVTMMLASDKLVVTHVSTHVPLSEAIRRVTKERVGEVVRLTDEALRRLGPRRRIAVAGLNPHAGEHGAFGAEDDRDIRPAVEAARRDGLDVSGPEPPDTVFFRAVSGRFDAVVCMYHDQGHIAMKLLDFESAVNVTLGLPFVRTSVDHGTAYDIAYQGVASTKSFVSAFRLARRLLAGD